MSAPQTFEIDKFGNILNDNRKRNITLALSILDIRIYKLNGV